MNDINTLYTDIRHYQNSRITLRLSMQENNILATKQHSLFYNIVQNKCILFTARCFEFNTHYLGEKKCNGHANSLNHPHVKKKPATAKVGNLQRQGKNPIYRFNAATLLFIYQTRSLIVYVSI